MEITLKIAKDRPTPKGGRELLLALTTRQDGAEGEEIRTTWQKFEKDETGKLTCGAPLYEVRKR